MLGRMLSQFITTPTPTSITGLSLANIMATGLNTLAVVTHSSTPQPKEVRATITFILQMRNNGTKRLHNFKVTKQYTIKPGLELG